MGVSYTIGRMTLLGSALLALTDVAAAQPSPGIIGSWRVVQFDNVENGKVFHRFGEKPLGLFVYTADGHVAIQISNPDNPTCIAPGTKYAPGRRDETNIPACTATQMQALIDGTIAYWGTYSVDMAASVVIHHVKSDLGNGYAGTDQPRPFRLDGDRLEIGDGKTWIRVLERVR